MAYLGIDIGFSQKARTTGIAVICSQSAEPVRAVHVRTNETLTAIERILEGRRPSAISIDGPLIPHPKTKRPFIVAPRYRDCEMMLSGGCIQQRCKPGSTASPRGQLLHRQTTFIANSLLGMWPGVAIFESFPNAFLGFTLPEKTFAEPIPRGKKSDVFWSACLSSGILRRAVNISFGPGKFSRAIISSLPEFSDHEERAAIICALTARAAHAGKAHRILSKRDGSVWLAPSSMMQPWARTVLAERQRHSRMIIAQRSRITVATTARPSFRLSQP